MKISFLLVIHEFISALAPKCCNCKYTLEEISRWLLLILYVFFFSLSPLPSSYLVLHPLRGDANGSKLPQVSVSNSVLFTPFSSPLTLSILDPESTAEDILYCMIEILE